MLTVDLRALSLFNCLQICLNNSRNSSLIMSFTLYTDCILFSKLIGFPLLLSSLIFFFVRKRNIMSLKNLIHGMVLLIYPTNQGISSTLIVILLRRQLLAIAALSIISWSSTLQTFVVGVILVGFAIIHLCFYPYSDLPHHNFASENSFEPLILLVLSMSFILLRFSALESSMSSTTASVWIIIVINSWILNSPINLHYFLPSYNNWVWKFKWVLL